MYFLIVLFLLHYAALAHAIETKRQWPWLCMIVVLPGFGLALYIIGEAIPAWLETPHATLQLRRWGKALCPKRNYRRLRKQFQLVETIHTAAALAHECVILRRWDEARELYETVVRSAQGDEPSYYAGLAFAQAHTARARESVATIQLMHSRWPQYSTSEIRLLYAKELEECGRLDEALNAYCVASYDTPSVEPLVRAALILKRQGEEEEARSLAQDILQAHHQDEPAPFSPQTRWIKQARKLAQ